MPDVDKKLSEIFVDNPVTPLGGDIIYLSRSGVDAAALISSLVSFIDPVFGPASSTLNAVPRFADTSGKLLKNSSATLTDAGLLSITTLSVSGDTAFGPAAVIGGLDNPTINFNFPFISPFVIANTFTAVASAPQYTTTEHLTKVQPVSDASSTFYAGRYDMLEVDGAFDVAQALTAAFYLDHQGSGHLAEAVAFYANASNRSTGTADRLIGAYVQATNFGGAVGEVFNVYIPTASGTSNETTRYGIWIGDQSAGVATNDYAFWHDSPGVFRIKGDGVMAYYNPSFTKYTPGATNFERIIQQWNANVAEIGVEVGGTGTLRALRLLGSSVEAAAYKVGATAGIDFSGAVTNITVSKGIVTAAS